MAERYPEAEVVVDDELMFDDSSPRQSTLARRDERSQDIVREGEVLAGKYRVERIPGRSGLGVVVQVRHLELGQEVTLKFLVPDACAYPEFVQRFVREARAAVRIQGEHVARVTDVGRLESGAPYMVREFLRGPDLAEVLKVRGALPISEAVDYIIQACEGVAEGHALGVVHRNVRPTTLVVTRRSDGTPLVKVVDFAAAESLHMDPFAERAVSLVGTSVIMASLPYLAPEQVRDPHDVDFRADVYSLGAVLFELLTATPLYSADGAPALLAMVAADSAPAVRTFRPDIPGELDHVVLRCLAKNRALRYASVADLVVALRPFASEEASPSISHIVRLGQRTSKIPEATQSRPSPSPSVASTPAPAPSVAPPPLRSRFGTLIMPSVPQVSAPPSRASVHDDVTTINPMANYGAPVVIRSTAPRSIPPALTDLSRVSELSRTDSPSAARWNTQPLDEEPTYEAAGLTEPLPPARVSTPQPPPLRSAPPPLRAPVESSPPPLPTPATLPAREASTLADTAPSVRAARSSLPGGVARSWMPSEPPPATNNSPRRLLGVAVVAACAALGAIIAFRAGAATTGVQPVIAAPVAAAPPPAVLLAPTTPPVAAAPVAVPATPAAAAPAAALPVAAPVAAAPVAAAPAVASPAAAPAAPVLAAAPVASPAVARPAAPVVRRSVVKPTEEAPSDKPRKPEPAPEQKVASSRPASDGDLFGDTR